MAEQIDVGLNVGLNIPPSERSRLQQQVDAAEKTLKPINLRFDTSTNTFRNLNQEVGQFNGYLERANQRVLGFGASVASLYGVVRFFKEIVTSTIEVEKSLTDMNSIFKLSASNLDRFSKGLFDIARNTSSSFATVSDAAKEYARQGLSVEETTKRTKDAMILARLANIGYAEAVTTLTTGINSFNKEALDSSTILAKLTSVDKSFAVSLGDLTGALSRVGSSASDVGISFDQLIALVTSAKQITGRDGSVIAQALNTIFTRINKTGTLDLLESLGVAVHNARGEMLPTIQVLANFAQTYDKLTGSIKTQAAEAVGGVRNLNTLKAVLSDLSKTQSVYSQVLNISSQSTDEAIRRNEALNKSASALLQNFATTNKQILSNLGGLTFNSLFKGGLDLSINNPITKALEDATGHAETTGGKIAEGILRGMGNSILIGAGPIIAKALSNVVARTLGGAAKAVLEEAGLNAESTKQAAIQSEIVNLYNRGGDALRQQLLTMSSLVEKAALFEGLMARQGVVAAAQQGELASIAALIGRRRAGGAAAGFVPFGMESSAIAAGVGGAPSSAKAVYLPDFPTGGGNRGIVANTSEWVVPHMAGGSAIFNRDMITRFGLPPGSKPVAAGGFVPHAAGGLPNAYEAAMQRIIGPANESIAGLGGVLSFGPPAPTASQWRKMGGNPADMLAKDFERAQKELADTAKQQVALEKRKLEEMESIYNETKAKEGLTKKENILTKTSINLQETRLRQYRSQVDSEAQAWKEEANFRRTQEIGVRNATVVGRPRSVLELRGLPGTNKGPLGEVLYEPQAYPEFTAQRRAQIEAQNAMIVAQTERDWNAPLGQAQGLKAKQRAIRARAVSDEIAMSARIPIDPLEDIGPYGPFLPAKRSLGSRFGLSTNKALLASFGLPFLGGTVEGLGGGGGTTSGIIAGGASSALNLAGLGAGIGSFGGPIGATIGLGAGGIIGGVYGALSKINKSYEELANEITTKNNRLSKQLGLASASFGIQEQLNEGGLSPKRAAELRAEQATNIASIEDPHLQQLVQQGLANPDKRDEAISYENQRAARVSTQGDLVGALSRVRSSSSLLNNLGIVSVSGSLFGIGIGFTPNFDKKGSSELASVLNPIITKLSPSQLKALQSINRRSPAAAIQSLARMAGLTPDQLDALAPGWATSAASYGLNIGAAIDSAVSKASATTAMIATVAATTPPQYDIDEITSLATDLRLKGQSGALRAGAAAQIGGVSQRIALANPSLTDIGRLSLEGQFGAANIGAQFAGQRGSLISEGVSGLLKAVPNTFRNKEAINDLAGINNLQGLIGLRGRLEATKGSGGSLLSGLGSPQFVKALDDLIRELQLLDKTEQSNLRVNEVSNRLMEQQLLNSRTLSGAFQQDVGDISKARQEFETSVDQRAPRGTQEANAYKLFLASANAQRRAGLIGEAGFEKLNAQFSLSQGATASQRQRDAVLSLAAEGNTNISGGDISGALFGNAKKAGQEGNSKGSFIGGFQSVFSGLKRDLNDFSDIGKNVADSLNSNLNSFWDRFVTGAEKGGEAFKGFITGVLGDASRALASKAFASLLGMIPGFTSLGATPSIVPGSASGGPIGLAGGGAVPTMLTGGEFYVNPQAAASIGYGRLVSMNAGLKRAGGGLIAGGSGLRDDISAMLPRGSFILKKAAVQQLGPKYLQSMVNHSINRASGGPVDNSGEVQYRAGGGFLGGFGGGFGLWGSLIGAVIGGGLGYLSGGKKGAIGGALLGGIGGGLYQGSGSSGSTITSPGGSVTTIAGTSIPMSVTERVALGLGTSAGLGLLAAGINDPHSTGPISIDQIPAYKRALLAQQASTLAGSPGQFPYLQIGPQGQTYIQGFTDAPATRHWSMGGSDAYSSLAPQMSLSTGGGVDAPMSTSNATQGSGSGTQVNIKVEINNGTANSSATSNGTNNQPFGPEFADKLNRQIRGVVQDELVQQSRSDGFFTQKGRFLNRA